MDDLDQSDRLRRETPAVSVRNALMRIPPGERVYCAADLKKILRTEFHMIYEQDYTEGGFANVLYGLVKKGFYEKPARNRYKRVPNPIGTEHYDKDRLDSLHEISLELEEAKRSFSTQINIIKDALGNLYGVIAKVPYTGVKTRADHMMMKEFL